MVKDKNQNQKAGEEDTDTEEGSNSEENSESEEHRRSRSVSRSSGEGQRKEKQRENSLGGRSENSGDEVENRVGAHEERVKIDELQIFVCELCNPNWQESCKSQVLVLSDSAAQ